MLPRQNMFTSTITEIGMASLLPEAEKGVEIVDAGGGKKRFGLFGQPSANISQTNNVIAVITHKRWHKKVW